MEIEKASVAAASDLRVRVVEVARRGDGFLIRLYVSPISQEFDLPGSPCPRIR